MDRPISRKVRLVGVGVAAVLVGSGAMIARAEGSGSAASASASAMAPSDSYREHLRECRRERARNPRDFRKDHGTLRRCVRDEHRGDVREERYDD